MTGWRWISKLSFGDSELLPPKVADGRGSCRQGVDLLEEKVAFVGALVVVVVVGVGVGDDDAPTQPSQLQIVGVTVRTTFLNCSQLIRNFGRISGWEEDGDVEEDIARVEIADLEIQMEVSLSLPMVVAGSSLCQC